MLWLVARGTPLEWDTTHAASFFYQALQFIMFLIIWLFIFLFIRFIPPVLIGMVESVLPGLKVVGSFIIRMLFLAVCFARLRLGFASAAAASDPRNDPRRFPRRLASACTVSYVRIPKYRKKGRRRRQNRISVVVRTRDEKEGLGFIYLCLYYVVYNILKIAKKHPYHKDKIDVPTASTRRQEQARRQRISWETIETTCW